MIIEKFVLTPFQQNTRIVACENTGMAICIDPGEKSEAVVRFINENKLNLQAIALTHGHLDHIGGVSDLWKSFPQVEIILHKNDEEMYYGLPQQPIMMGLSPHQLKSMGMDYETPPPLTRNWEDEENYKVGNLNFQIRHCPGHTRGHVIFIEAAEKKVFAGDCLFEGSIGRTDLPGGSMKQLLSSIDEKLLTLADDFIVYTGHGNETTIGHERKTNPFFTGVYQINRGKFV